MSNSWRTSIRALGIIVPTLLLATFVRSQTPQREALTEPTYRVSKSNDISSAPNSVEPIPGTRPVLDAPPPVGTTPHAPKDVPVEVDTNSAESTSTSLSASATPVPVAAPPTIPDPQPQLTESEEVFNQAMADSKAMLSLIQRDVKDYTCVFSKREKIDKKGIIGPQYMLVKVRSRQMEGNQIVVPFSVYMKFVKPNDLKGREVLYIENVENGKVLCKEGGTKGRWMPALYLSTTSRFVMADNRYPITEFGIETLTQRLIDRGTADRNIADTKVTYKDGATVCGRACKFLEIKREQPKVGEFAELGMNVPLARVFFDKELNIPIRYVAYDWPENGESAEVLEEYTYQNLKINVGLTDLDFDRENPEYGF